MFPGHMYVCLSSVLFIQTYHCALDIVYFVSFQTNGIFNKATYNNVRMVHSVCLGVTDYNFQKCVLIQ